jgi:hypothetical protein
MSYNGEIPMSFLRAPLAGITRWSAQTVWCDGDGASSSAPTSCLFQCSCAFISISISAMRMLYVFSLTPRAAGELPARRCCDNFHGACGFHARRPPISAHAPAPQTRAITLLCRDATKTPYQIVRAPQPVSFLLFWTLFLWFKVFVKISSFVNYKTKKERG